MVFRCGSAWCIGCAGHCCWRQLKTERVLWASLRSSLDLPVELVQLDAAVVFAPAQPTYDIDMREWVTFARTAEVGSR